MAVTKIRTKESSNVSTSANQHELLPQDETALIDDEIERQIACLYRDLEKLLGFGKEVDARAHSSVIDGAGRQLPFEFDSSSVGLRLRSCGVYISSHEEFVLVILHKERETTSLSGILAILQESNLEILQLKSRAIVSKRSFLTSIHAKVNDLALGFSEETLRHKLVHVAR